MAAIATIQNPLSKDPETLLFFLTQDNQPFLQRRAPNSPDPLNTPSLPRGPISNPSSFAVLRYDDIIECYGVLTETQEHEGSSDPTYKVYAVSPVYRPLEATTDLPVLAACGDGLEQGWVYYLRGKEQPTLCEILLNGGPTIQDCPDTSPIPTTYLAACYDPILEKRYCFYQGKKDIKCYDADGENIDSVSNTDDVKDDNSPMAACTIPAPDGKSNYLVLYYVNTKNELQRVTYMDGRWRQSQSEALRKARDVDDWSQMAVVADDAAKQCRVFYVQKDQKAKGFVMFSDDYYQK